MPISAAPVFHTTKAGLNGCTTNAVNTITAAPNFIAVHAGFYNGVSAGALSDSAGNTWVPRTQKTTTGGVCSRIFECENPALSATHTFTWTGGTSAVSLQVAGWTGVKTGAFDQESGNTVLNNQFIKPGAKTPSVDGCLILTGIGTANNSNNGLSADSGFTVSDSIVFAAGNNQGGAFAYKLQTTAASVDPQWDVGTSTTDLASTLAIYKASPDTPRTPAAGAAALTGNAPLIQRSETPVLTPGAGALVATGNAPGQGITITPTKGALVLAGSQPVVATVTIIPHAGALALTGNAPVLTQAVQMTPPSGSLYLESGGPITSVSITPLAGALVITGSAPSLGNILTPGTGSLGLTTSAPTVGVSFIVQPAAGALAAVGSAPNLGGSNVNRTPAAGAITLAGSAPDITSSGSVSITPVSGSLSLTTSAPLEIRGTLLQPPAGAIAVAGVVAVPRTDTRITPDTGELDLIGSAPNVQVSGQGSITPLPGVLSLLGSAPTLRTDTIRAPPSGTLTLDGNAPDVSGVTSVTIRPSTGQLVFEGQTATAAVSGVVIQSGAIALAPTRRQFVVGEVVELLAIFRFENGDLFDPAAFLITIRTPDEVTSDITLNLRRQSVGVYFVRYVTTQTGLHQYRFYASTPGLSSTAGEGYFTAQTEF